MFYQRPQKKKPADLCGVGGLYKEIICHVVYVTSDDD